MHSAGIFLGPAHIVRTEVLWYIQWQACILCVCRRSPKWYGWRPWWFWAQQTCWFSGGTGFTSPAQNYTEVCSSDLHHRLEIFIDFFMHSEKVQQPILKMEQCVPLSQFTRKWSDNRVFGASYSVSSALKPLTFVWTINRVFSTFSSCWYICWWCSQSQDLSCTSWSSSTHCPYFSATVTPESLLL